MKYWIFPAAAITHILFIALTAHAADPASAAAVPSPLETAKKKYVATAKQVEANLRTFQVNGPTCGMVGSMIAGKVQGADQAQARSRAQIESLLTGADNADAKKKAQAKNRIDAEIAVLKQAKIQVDQNLLTIQNALSTQSPTCAKANQAFFASRAASNVMIQQLEAARKALSTKRVVLRTEEVREFNEAKLSSAAPEQAPEAEESLDNTQTADLR